MTGLWMLIVGVALIAVYEVVAALTMRPTISQMTWRFKAAHP